MFRFRLKSSQPWNWGWWHLFLQHFKVSFIIIIESMDTEPQRWTMILLIYIMTYIILWYDGYEKALSQLKKVVGGWTGWIYIEINPAYSDYPRSPMQYTGCFYKLLPINLVWGPFKYSKSNFNTVHVFLHFKSFCLVVLKVIFASKLSELQQFENWAANYQGWKWGKLLRVEIRQKKLTNAINKI